MKPHFNGNTKLVLTDENFKVDDTNCNLHVLVSKNIEFGKTDEKEKTRNWFWIEPQAVPIQVSNVDGDKKSYFVKLRISNPKDISLELLKGDKVGLGRIEVKVNPEKPDFLPYSEVKKSLPNDGKPKRKNNRRRRTKRRAEEAEKQKKREAERKENSSKLSFDLDALDFEPVNSDEEKDGNDKVRYQCLSRKGVAYFHIHILKYGSLSLFVPSFLCIQYPPFSVSMFSLSLSLCLSSKLLQDLATHK